MSSTPSIKLVSSSRHEHAQFPVDVSMTPYFISPVDRNFIHADPVNRLLMTVNRPNWHFEMSCILLGGLALLWVPKDRSRTHRCGVAICRRQFIGTETLSDPAREREVLPGPSIIIIITNSLSKAFHFRPSPCYSSSCNKRIPAAGVSTPCRLNKNEKIAYPHFWLHPSVQLQLNR